jgi:flagellar basal-body rod protein FlgB
MLKKGAESADVYNMNTFAKTVDMLHRALSANTVRRSVIANNIANSGVPNFKRSMVNFESELKRALDTEKQKPALEMTRTNPVHFSNYRERDYRDVQIRRVLDYTSTYNNNGNNVDPEQEFMAALENQMTYGLLASSIKFELDQVSSVLKS